MVSHDNTNFTSFSNTECGDHSYHHVVSSTPAISIDNEFFEWQVEQDEFELYLKHCFEESITNSFFTEQVNFEILKFWLSAPVKQKFPFLSKVAIGVLCILASSSPSEKAFSACGSTVTKKGTRFSFISFQC